MSMLWKSDGDITPRFRFHQSLMRLKSASISSWVWPTIIIETRISLTQPRLSTQAKKPRIHLLLLSLALSTYMHIIAGLPCER